MSLSFTKTPGEQFMVAVDFCQALPETSTLGAVTLSAIDLVDRSDASSEVLASQVGEIEGTQARAFVQGGAHGHSYCVHFVVSVVPGSPVPTLEEEVVMVVRQAC
jgi:hypothetical protein